MQVGLRRPGMCGACSLTSVFSPCSVCHDGGELLCCDTCCRAYHATCLEDSENPDADEVRVSRRAWAGGRRQASDVLPLLLQWHCPLCFVMHVETCIVCGETGDKEERLLPCR